MTRVEACACGGSVAAPDGDWPAIAAAVLLHNRGPRHVAYVVGVACEEAEMGEGAEGAMRVILGPMGCMGCGAPVSYGEATGQRRAMLDGSGRAHACGARWNRCSV